MFGVSPAFFISAYGDRFSPSDYCHGIDRLTSLGYSAAQIEVFHADTIPEWVDGGFAVVVEHAAQRGLSVPQCVGHVLLNAFINENALNADWGIAEIDAIASALLPRRCPVITIPIPAFSAQQIDSIERWRSVDRRFTEKLGEMARRAQSYGFTVALEVLPGSLVGGVAGFLRLAEQLEIAGCAQIGLNLDTGHAWASREVPALAISRLAHRIAGTHLCDNFGTENLSLAPGKGSIDWHAVMGTLRSTGYRGSLDIEIHCPAENVDEQYSAARDYLGARIAEPITEEVV